MKIEALSPEQIEKARSLATDEERLAYLKECGVELDDDMLAEVAGGIDDFEKLCKHTWKKTGNRRKGWLMGWIDDVEYRCTKCGKKSWRAW